MTIQSVAVRTIFRFAPRDARTGGALSGSVYCYIALDEQTKLDWTFYSQREDLRWYSEAFCETWKLGIYSTDWHSVVWPIRIDSTREWLARRRRAARSLDARLRRVEKMAGKCWYY